MISRHLQALDDTLHLRRAHSVGHHRQWLNLLGFGLMTNSLTLAEHGRVGPPLEHAA
jgi:hypothetical protein